MTGHRPYRLHRPWTVLGSRELLDADPFLKVRVETVEEPLMREVRYLDKLIDELAKGRPMEKILRA